MKKRCWVAKRHIDLAMAEFEGRAEFRICWQPFFLFSGVPDEGMPFLEHLRSIGGPDLEEKVAARKGLLFQRSEELVSTRSQLNGVMMRNAVFCCSAPINWWDINVYHAFVAS